VKDISAVEATKNYVDFLVETGKTRTSVAEILASMTPCLRLYAFLGNGIHTASSEQFLASNPYRLWVQTYAAPDFEVFLNVSILIVI
jgi:thiaminase/transcriptional activator TenA